jgi:2-alkyl-3-oxoalkanoate reductase
MSTVFVTGATGVLGRATIPQLLAAGYSVRALSRSESNDAAIRALGAEPVRGDLFDQVSLIRAMTDADAVLHLATRIPPSSKMRRRSAWNENDRIRAQGTKNLVDAALAAGVQVFVYPSFAFVYPDSGDSWIDAASTPVDPIDTMRSTIAAEQEAARFAAEGDGERRGIALRLGGLYGSDLPSMMEQLQLARRGVSMFGSAPDAFTPMLWIDDAASALVAALERAPSGLYDVVDDEPIRQGQVKQALAAAMGRRKLVSLPAWLIRLMAGPTGAALTRSLRVSNRRFRDATGWAPTVRNAVEGLGMVAPARDLTRSPHVPVVVRIGLWLMALFTLLAGIQQQFAPRWFYDNFPGFGRRWVSVDGPYNEHLLRDLGGANLALAVIIVFAIARPTIGLVRAVAAALLLAQVPHFIYHAAHLDILATPLDRVLQTASLGLTLLIPLLVFVAARGIGQQQSSKTCLSGGVDATSAGLRPQLVTSSH